MKTNFSRETHLVLTDSDGEVVAIILCEKGLQDINSKLFQAMIESRCAESAYITPIEDNQTMGDDWTDSFCVEVVLKYEGVGEVDETCNLFRAAIY